MKTIALFTSIAFSEMLLADYFGVLKWLLSLWLFGFMLIGLWCYFKHRSIKYYQK